MLAKKLLFYLGPPLLAICVLLTTTLKTDLSAFIIAGDNAAEILLASEMQSGALSRRYLIAISHQQKSIVSSKFLHKLKSQLEKIEGIVKVWPPGQQQGIRQAMVALYSDHAAGHYSSAPEAHLTQLFTREGLNLRAKQLKQTLLSPQGHEIKQIALKDPLLLSLDGFKSLAKKMLADKWREPDYRHLIVETRAAGLDTAAQKQVTQALRAGFAELNQAWQNQFQLEMTGVPVFAVATQTLIQGDVVRISLISSFALILLFLWLFRSFNVLFQVMTLLMSAILSGILVCSLVFDYVHIMTIAMGSTLIGICIDYPIHAFAHAQSVSTTEKTAAIIKIWPSMVLGGITTLIGYTALGFSGYPGLRQVTVYAAVGIFVALILTRFILPALIQNQQRLPLTIPLIENWLEICIKYRILLITTLTIAFLASLSTLDSIRWMQDIQELTPELSQLKENDRRIRNRILSMEPGRFILVSAATLEPALQKAESLYPLLEQLKKNTALDDYYGVQPWLLSSQKQQHNQRLLVAQLNDKNRSLWQDALQQQGLSLERLGHLNYPIKPPLQVDEILQTDIGKLIDSRIIQTDKQTVIMIWLAHHQPDAVENAIAGIEGVQYFSQRDLLNKMTRQYTDQAKRMLLAGLALILLLLSWRYRSLWIGMRTLLPAVLAAFLIFGFWAFMAIPVSFLHLIGFLLAIAICVDYGIFYQEKRSGNIVLTYQAMAASMLTSMVAFSALMAAESTSLRILAAVVVFGIFLGFLLCPVIIRHRLLN